MAEKEEITKLSSGKKDFPSKGNCQGSEWKVPEYSSSHGNGDAKNDSSSTSSFFSSSNLTTSCSGVEEHDEQEPSTSGCSSFLAHSQNNSNKTKKKERVKEYLKELKSMVQPPKHTGSRMGTLSTLQHVLTSMRKIKEAKQKSRLEAKAMTNVLKEQEYSAYTGEMMHTFYESDSHESLTSESLKCNVELRIILTPNDHIVRTVSNNMKYVLGYPKECWIGRSLDDYVHKKDLITFNSFHKGLSDSDMEVAGDELESESKIFYFRLRKFKSLGQSGFSLRKQDYFMPFQCTFTRKLLNKNDLKQHENTTSWYDETSTSGISGSPGDGSQPAVGEDTIHSPNFPHGKPMSPDKAKVYTILYCVPLVSPYIGPHLPEIKTFETRHTLFCSYCHVQPNTVPLLGYLPQEMIGVSIFDFYHNEDLKALYNIYTKVITLKSVPYKSGPIRFLAKNGSWVNVVTEWSSFVNPWSKRLEFIIGKHEVVSGPENRDVFSENFHMPTLEETPDHVLQARQKIKDLLLQPVETVYVGSSPDMGPSKTKKTKSGKTVAVAEGAYLPSQREGEPETAEGERMYQDEETRKACTHAGGVLFRDGSIGQAYEQLNYTNCIKKFLLSQPLTFSSDSDAKKSSSEDGGDTEEEKQNLSSDSNFEFDISVPKPPSFGSSTKVLVSEQGHRDNETSLDPMSLREQLQLPLAVEANISSQAHQQQREVALSTTDSPPIMTLTRESLWKHTLLQEQLYIATASPDRNILFMNQQKDNQCLKHPLRQSLKRSHSPDTTSSSKLKSGRHSDSLPVVSTSAAILNPSFPLSTFNNTIREEGESSSKSQTSNSQMMFPIKMYPIMSLCQSPPHSEMVSTDQTSASSSKMQQWQFYTMPGMTMAPKVMMGFHQSKSPQQCMPQHIGTPIPVHQLNSYLMQQANMMTPRSINRMSRKKQELKKNKNLPTSSSDDSFEETSSSLYLIESQQNKMSQMIMQSLAQQLSHKGLSPAPWLENIHFLDSVQLKYHMMKNKHKRVLKKDREFIEKVIQPEIVLCSLINC
nr:period [Sinonovacula constricta]